MQAMFYGAASFNSDLSAWNVASMTYAKVRDVALAHMKGTVRGSRRAHALEGGSMRTILGGGPVEGGMVERAGLECWGEGASEVIAALL